jgi:DNA-binding YbaB/EbfC family protein
MLKALVSRLQLRKLCHWLLNFRFATALALPKAEIGIESALVVRHAADIAGCGQSAPVRGRYSRVQMFKGIGNFAAALKQASQIRGKLDALTEDLKNRRATGTSGGGMVEVEVNGLTQVLRVTIDPALIERRDKEMLEDLLPAAINQAIDKAKEQYGDVMKQLAGGMDLSNLGAMLGMNEADPGDLPPQ